MLSRTRRVDVLVFDDSKGLPVELALLWEVNGLVTRDNDADIVKKVIFDHIEQFKTILINHNNMRTQTRDDDLYDRTGLSANLRAIDVTDLRFEVV